MDDYLAVGIAEGFEESESDEQTLEAWQHLVDTGIINHLQGHFGRRANELIKRGLIYPAGVPQGSFRIRKKVIPKEIIQTLKRRPKMSKQIQERDSGMTPSYEERVTLKVRFDSLFEPYTLAGLKLRFPVVHTENEHVGSYSWHAIRKAVEKKEFKP